MTYAEIIEQTYISPIRSVVAVDDEFPTLDDVLDALAEQASDVVPAEPSDTAPIAEGAEAVVTPAEEAAMPAKQREYRITVVPKEAARAREILNYCRQKQWIVDVHNGEGVFHDDGEGNEIIRHLHQTDLLILDYQLNGEAQGGESSIRVLRSLAVNPHFNMVVIYTNKPVKDAFREIAIGLLRRSSVSLHEEVRQKASDAWDDWLDADKDTLTPFAEMIDADSYIGWRARGGKDTLAAYQEAFPLAQQLGAAVGQKIAALSAERRIAVLDVIKLLLSRFEETVAAQFNASGLENLEVRLPSEDGANWVRSENLFVTVIPKRTDGGRIVEELKLALTDWNPTPHQIMLSQMRAKLEESGGAIEEKALSDGYVQAGLLWQMLEPNEQLRAPVLTEILERQWSEVLAAMSVSVVKQAADLVASILARGLAREEAVHSYYPKWFESAVPPANREVWLRLNSYWSSQPVNGRHLTTGHIFELNGHYWVCLSPACDLVPEQGRDQRWRGRLGGETHFKALKLTPISPEVAYQNATRGICVYLKIGNEIVTGAFVDPVLVGDVNPDWEQMIALNEGKFDTGNVVTVRYLHSDGENGLRLAEGVPVTVVGQLRYEYALNLLQRLGNSLSRIGLNFMRPQ